MAFLTTAFFTGAFLTTAFLAGALALLAGLAAALLGLADLVDEAEGPSTAATVLSTVDMITERCLN